MFIANPIRIMKSPSLHEAIPEGLDDEVDHIEQEARMVLPGIQALLGFQLIAAFNQNFKTLLTQNLQELHLFSLICVAISVILVLTPAAYHRQAERGKISRFFAQIASLFLTLAMIPMMLGIVIDVYVITLLVTGNHKIATVIFLILLSLFLLLWFIFPKICKLKYATESTLNPPL